MLLRKDTCIHVLLNQKWGKAALFNCSKCTLKTIRYQSANFGNKENLIPVFSGLLVSPERSCYDSQPDIYSGVVYSRRLSTAACDISISLEAQLH